MLFAAFCILAACAKEENFDQPVEEKVEAKTYTLSIPATMGSEETPSNASATRAVTFDGTTSNSTFSADEKVYVYNKTTGAFLSTFNMMEMKWDGYLSPTNISPNGKSCTLSGELSGTLSENDELLLLYNVNETGDGFLEHFAYNYSSQRGTETQLIDGATAEVTLDSFAGGVFTTKAPAEFTNIQSLFRFQFSYNAAPLSIQKLKIRSVNGALIGLYSPLVSSGLEGPYSYGSAILTPASSTSDYLYASLFIDENKSSGDQLMFTVTGSDGYVYRTTKAAPSGGFHNGKYYYNSSAIAIPRITQDKAPDIKWNTPSSCSPTFNKYYVYNVIVDVELSGTGYGYYFHFSKGATVKLDGLSYWYDDGDFINAGGSEGNLILDIKGDNSITCVEAARPIFTWGNLKLKGNGTLTITVGGTQYAGIYGFQNYTSSSANPSNLAYSGSTVTRSARTDNLDGTYSWTYTVSTP